MPSRRPRFMVLREIVVENGWFRGGPATINQQHGVRLCRRRSVRSDRAGRRKKHLFGISRSGAGRRRASSRLFDQDYDAATADLLARGYRLVQRGTFGDTKFGYFESSDDPGTMTEIVYLDPNVRGMFANIKAQTF